MKRILSIFICISLWTCALAGDTPQTNVTVASYPQTNGTTHYVIDFKDKFDNNSEQVTVAAFKQTKKGDTVTIKINSPGGYLSAVSAILNAMEESPATVKCELGEWVSSGAAILAWNCPTLTVSHKSVVLYHKAAMGTLPLILEPRLTSNVLDKHSRSLQNTDAIILALYLEGAMTPSELASYNAGLNVIIDGKTVVKRHQKYYNYKVQSDPQDDIDKHNRPLHPDRLPTRR